MTFIIIKKLNFAVQNHPYSQISESILSNTYRVNCILTLGYHCKTSTFITQQCKIKKNNNNKNCKKCCFIRTL